MPIPRVWPDPPNAELQRRLRAERKSIDRLQVIRDEIQRVTPSSAFINSSGGEKTSSGVGVWQPLDADLTAIAALSSNGLIARTGAGTAAVKIIGTDVQAVLMVRTGTILSPAIGDDTIEYVATNGGGAALTAENDSATDNSNGVVGNASGASGATVGVKGIGASTDNDAYGGHFAGAGGASLYCGGAADFLEASTPATPPSGIVRPWFDTSGHLNYKDDAGAVHGPIVDMGRGVCMVPIGLSKIDNTTLADSTSDRATFVYLGRAWKSVASGATIKVQIRLTRVYQSGGAGPWAEVGIMRGTPACAANATLDPVGTIDVSTTWAAPTVPGNKTLSITTSAAIVKGDDLWLAVGSKTNVLNGTYEVRGLVPDELGGGLSQTKGTSGALSAYSGTSVSVTTAINVPWGQLWL